jgi:Ca2+-binding EF-hand superfamily protein
MKYFKSSILSTLLLTTFAFSASAAPAASPSKTTVTYQSADRNRDGVITLKEWRTESDNVFTSHDWNNDGIISGAEMKAGAVKPKSSSDPFRALDSNQDGVIVLGEWEGSTTAFQQLDTNNDDRLSAEEFHTRANLDQFAELDHNGDGIISRTEWHNSSASFVNMDRNRDEKITREEFYDREQYPTSVFRELDVNNDKRISRSEWRDEVGVFTRTDVNGDNFVSENEFNNRQNVGAIEQIFKDIFRSR